ncbi:rho GTPase activating protein at 71E isoform X1 [Rhynchophorus ferrugineus]|uniref:rho GTPase activating protein at 71E isoform X1 n=1 Tax=Rhynchophorus ferrugineus TaxID=354439 RepID=UPI003FCC98EC
MSTWAARMHRRAATFSNVVTSCGHPSGPYPRRLEKVKFGVPLEEVCKNDIPGPLLVLILKLNKEAPYRKDVFRAPGHQGAMKKLIHFLQTGRLVNMDNFSVYTIASVLKKFLRKVPGGIFGKDIEQEFFQVIEFSDLHLQRDEIHRIITSLPRYTQKLLVLLFGTFRVIASNSEKAGTGMTSEALGVSVAPSFFHSCVSDGKTAKMEDVMKFKVASRVMKHLIEEFASSNLFGKDNYEYYARVTGRVLRVQGEWICSFQYPPTKGVFPNEYVALERYLLAMSQGEECQSTPALLEVGLQPQVNSSSLGMIAEHTLLESCTRLSISLEQNGLFQNNTSHSSSTSHSSKYSYTGPKMTLDELKAVNAYAESTRSLSYLPLVHERQTERMKTRSQWFLGPSVDCSSCGGSLDIPLNKADVSALTNALLRRSSSGTIVGVAGLSLSAESIQKRPSIKRANSRDKRYVQRSASRRNKENGSRSSSFKGRNERRGSGSRSNSFKIKYDNISRSCSFKNKGELCSCPVEGSSALENGNKEDNLPLDTAKTKETICVTLTYKPRI